MGVYERPGYGFPSPLVDPSQHLPYTEELPAEQLIEELHSVEEQRIDEQPIKEEPTPTEEHTEQP